MKTIVVVTITLFVIMMSTTAESLRLSDVNTIIYTYISPKSISEAPNNTQDKNICLVYCIPPTTT